MGHFKTIMSMAFFHRELLHFVKALYHHHVLSITRYSGEYYTSQITELHGCFPLDDESLSRSTLHESSFSNSYMRSLECLSGRPESVLDVINDKVGAMYDDEHGMEIIQA